VQWLDRHIVAPVFVTAASEDSYAIDAHGAALSGMPLYNLDGQAFAIATGSAHGTAYPAREALERLTVRAASGRAIDAALGMTFQALTAPLVRVFHPTGALVTSVVPSGPAASAGIVHGDVVTAIGEMTVDSPEGRAKSDRDADPWSADDCCSRTWHAHADDECDGGISIRPVFPRAPPGRRG
jgi:S1-C subfamily serine protease